MKTYIYAMCCPHTGEPRYIGKADKPESRVKRHIREAYGCEAHLHKSRWIRGLADEGLRPGLLLLQHVEFDKWQECERGWIRDAERAGWKLTNIAEGGEGKVNSLDNRKARFGRLVNAMIDRDESSRHMTRVIRWAINQARSGRLEAIAWLYEKTCGKSKTIPVTPVTELFEALVQSC